MSDVEIDAVIEFAKKIDTYGQGYRIVDALKAGRFQMAWVFCAQAMHECIEKTKPDLSTSEIAKTDEKYRELKDLEEQINRLIKHHGPKAKITGRKLR